MSYAFRASFWFGIYFLLIVLPLVIGTAAPPQAEGAGFLNELAMALGFSGLAMMALEFTLISRVRSVAGAFGDDALLEFHRWMGFVSFALVLAHPAVLIVEGLPWSMLNPFSGEVPWMWRTGVISLWLLVLLVVQVAWRRRLRLSYEWWKLLHSLLGSAAVLLGFAHIYMVSWYTRALPMKILWYGYFIFLFILAVRYRLIRPLRLWRIPWEVSRNQANTSDTRTLWLRPVGHPGMRFEPGQYAWLNTGKTPFHLEQHPISISSSAEVLPETPDGKHEVGFSIKALGDWSSGTVPSLQPGSRVWVDGPYGAFSPDRAQGPGYVLIGGGAGITPLLSICATFADREDFRPVLVFYACPEEGDLGFREEFEKLKERANLKVVYVLDAAPPEWKGERGHITREMLARFLPKQHRRYQFFVCGPPPMMDAMESILPSLGVPPDQIHTERFHLA